MPGFFRRSDLTRGVCIAIACLHLAACGTDSNETEATAQDQADAIRIYRDAYGTPHIYADSNYSVFFGYGYAVAEDRLFQIEMLRRTTSGTTAEVLGSEFLSLDTHIRTHYDLPGIAEQVAALAPEDLELLEAYANGFNKAVNEVLADPVNKLPAEFRHFDFMPAANWNAVDVALLFAGSIAHRYSDFNSEQDNLALLEHFARKRDKKRAWDMFNSSKWLLDNSSPTTAESSSILPSEQPPDRPAYLDQLTDLGPDSRIVLDDSGRFRGYSQQAGMRETLLANFERFGMQAHPEFAPASNFWAQSGLSDADGALVNGPQFGFSTPSYVYGIGLHGGEFDVVGNTLLALPALLFAHNTQLGWGSTAGLSDQVDVFIEQLDPGNTERYLHDGQSKAFERWEEQINVRGAEPVTVVARRSVHGMVTDWRPLEHRALSRARAWDGKEVSTLIAWIRLATDRTLAAADLRIAGIATNINLYTMDSKGELGYRHAGHYPVRVEGHDPRLPAPGTGQWDWLGIKAYDANPGVQRPTSGRVVNWNNRPAVNWPSSDLWTTTWGRADRVWILKQLIESKEQHSIESLWNINRVASLADVYAPVMLPLLERAFKSVDPTQPVADALTHLLAWDQQWSPASDGYFEAAPTLMSVWLQELIDLALADEFSDPFFHLVNGVNTPDGPIGAAANTGPGIRILVHNIDRLLGNQDGPPAYDFFNGEDPLQVIRKGFINAVGRITSEFGSDPSLWRSEAAPMVWSPYNFRGVPGTLPDHQIQLPSYLNRGSENNLFIARDGLITGFDVIAPGQSGKLGQRAEPSAHAADQMTLYAAFDYKPLPFSETEARSAAVERKVIHSP